MSTARQLASRTKGIVDRMGSFSVPELRKHLSCLWKAEVLEASGLLFCRTKLASYCSWHGTLSVEDFMPKIDLLESLSLWERNINNFYDITKDVIK
uniref:Uncharacterized protein n=1 Tax=Romanomermis culicivorax TaxID=13658 RepID=A0A915INA2_ROMCU